LVCDPPAIPVSLDASWHSGRRRSLRRRAAAF
jgi:hypothetical protein